MYTVIYTSYIHTSATRYMIHIIYKPLDTYVLDTLYDVQDT